MDVLDKRIEATGLFYARFMDDWVVLAPTRWKLRHAVRIVNETLVELKVEQHPDKTFIGRIERGFAFLGYQMNAAGLTGVAPPTLERFVERVTWLYEQGALTCLGAYVRRWLIWVKSGLQEIIHNTDRYDVAYAKSRIPNLPLDIEPKLQHWQVQG